MRNINSLRYKNRMIIGMAFVIFLSLIQINQTASAEESITVYCYRDNRSVGSVVVFDISTAAAACNNVYYDCKGKCIGCYHDFDYVDYVCADIWGRTFFR